MRLDDILCCVNKYVNEGFLSRPVKNSAGSTFILSQWPFLCLFISATLRVLF